MSQAEDNDNEERAADINEAYMNSSGGESDDDEDQDEEDLAAAEKREKEEQAQASLQHLESGAAQLESALEFQQKVLVNITDKDKDRESNKRKLDRMGSSGENDSAGGGAVRSGAVAGTDKSGAKLRMVNHVSIANGEVQGSKASPVYSAASSSSSTSSALSEDNVRAYIKRHGGRVQSKVLMKVSGGVHVMVVEMALCLWSCACLMSSVLLLLCSFFTQSGTHFLFTINHRSSRSPSKTAPPTRSCIAPSSSSSRRRRRTRCWAPCSCSSR